MKHSQRVFLNRILSGVLVFVLVVGVILNPVTMLPTFATDSLVKLNYKNHNKSDVELYVQTDEVNYKPGDEMELTLYVQNNSDEMLSGVGLSWDGDKDVFSEMEFVGVEELGAEINEKGNVENLNLDAGEVVSLGFVGTLDEDLEDLNRRKISFFYGAETESGETVTDRTYFEFTVGLFDELSVEFEDGNELIPDEMSELHIRMSFNDLGYYYEAEDGGEDAAELATDSNTITATDSNTELATDSNAEIATDSNTELATGSDAEVATDSDTEEEMVEEYVFEINDVSLNLDTYGAEFKNVVLKDTMVTEGQAEIVTTALFELDEETEAGEYFGTLQAVVKSGKKEYKAEIGFQFEVVNETVTTGFKKHGLFTADVDNFTVHVQVPKGAFDEKVELSVTELAEDSEAYQEAEEAMANHDRVYDGMMALDICFLNEEGEEVEPKEGYNVQVSIEMNADVLPEGIDTESLMVHHIAETATASDAAEVVVEDVADTADVTAGLIEVKETVEAPVVAAEFEVERFSTFTITWKGNYQLNLQLIDTAGTSIGTAESSPGTLNNALTITKDTNPIGGYTYKRAVVSDSPTNAVNNGITIQRVRRSNNNATGEWQYHENITGTNDWSDLAGSNQVYLIYESNTFLGEDTSGFINIHMTNFADNDKSKFLNNTDGVFNIGKHGDNAINKYTDGNGVYQGIVKNVLAADGYPLVANDGSSLKTFFTGGTNANHLFQIGHGEDEGYYYYDSDLNAAYLNSNGNFDLYKYPHATGSFDSGAEPQFMPYHKMSGDSRTEGGYSYYPYIKNDGTLVSAKPGASAADYYFGMYVSFNFLMPKDGKVEVKDANGNTTLEPMEFKFDGDDDVWVFIDDVLVLDLGGVHQSSGGSINFADGTVTVNNIKNNEWGKNTDLKTMYNTAQGTVDDTTWEKTKASKVSWVGNTFNDYSQHTLKFFYMERGAGGSNCKLKFNLPAIPEGSLRIEKQLTHDVTASTDAKKYIENSVDYKFKVVKANGDLYLPSTKSGVTNQYKVYENGEYKETRTLDETGIITLKAKQYALFENMVQYDADGDISDSSVETYYVQEIMDGAVTGQYKEILYTVNGDGGSHKTAGGENNDFNTYRSGAITNDQAQYVLFRNKVDLDKLSILNVTKVVAPGSADSLFSKSYRFKIELGQGNGSLAPIAAGTKYQVSDKKGTVVKAAEEGGYITLSHGQTARLVDGILAGTHYRVSEEITSDGGYKAIYSGTIESSDKPIGGTPAIASTGVTGDFTLGDTVHVTVTNTDYDFTAELPISKDTLGFEKVNNASTFRFEVVPCNASGETYMAAAPYVGSTIIVPANHADSAAPIENKITLGGRTGIFVTDNIYYYKVTERAETDDAEKDAMIWFDDTEYIVGIRVTTDGVSVDSIKKNGEVIENTSTLAFVNRYDNTTTVTLDKVVAGNFGDRTKMFTFTVTVDGTVSTYELGDSTSVVTIEDVPIGATVSITESDNTGYEVNATVTNTELETFTGNTLTFEVTDKNGHAVVFTNTKNAVIDTGITMDTMPYILILLAVIGCIAFVVIRKRKDDDLD